MLCVKVTQVNVGGSVAVVDALLCLFFNLFDDLDHDQSHIHVSFFFVPMLSINKCP
jgi:hypothetical protein